MNQHLDLIEAAEQMLRIVSHRWRALPVGSHEKQTMQKLADAIAQARSGSRPTTEG